MRSFSTILTFYILGLECSNAFTIPTQIAQQKQQKNSLTSLNMVIDPSDLTSFIPFAVSSSNILADASEAVAEVATDVAGAGVVTETASTASTVAVEAASSEVAQSTYSKVSYYTTLGLYVMSFPGLWSQIKRSTTAKLKRKTYIRFVRDHDI